MQSRRAAATSRVDTGEPIHEKGGIGVRSARYVAITGVRSDIGEVDMPRATPPSSAMEAMEVVAEQGQQTTKTRSIKHVRVT